MKAVRTVRLPDLGEGVAEGEIVAWFKEVGERVEKDEPVLSVMTDKATVELPSPYRGILIKRHGKAGSLILKGESLYEVETEEEAEKEAAKELKEPILKREAPQEEAPRAASGGLPAAPKVRKLARELGVQLEKIQGSGPQGRILKEDLLESLRGERRLDSKRRASPPIEACTPALHLQDDLEKPLSGLRNAIAEKMVESKYIVPHYSFFDSLDAAALIEFREKIQREFSSLRLTYMPFFIRALSLVLRLCPELNGSLDLEKNSLIIHSHHNIGIALNSEEGLVVAVLKEVQEKSLEELIRSYDELIGRSRRGALARSDLIDSTITISNFGPLGGRWATPIINYPEVAILGLAKIRKEAVAKGDSLEARPLMNLSWSFDHRVIDGSLAAKASNELIRLIEHPEELL